jgi:hypothetical protein
VTETPKVAKAKLESGFPFARIAAPVTNIDVIVVVLTALSNGEYDFLDAL